MSVSSKGTFRTAGGETEPICGDTFRSSGCVSKICCTDSITVTGGAKFSTSPDRRGRLGGGRMSDPWGDVSKPYYDGLRLLRSEDRLEDAVAGGSVGAFVVGSLISSGG